MAADPAHRVEAQAEVDVGEILERQRAGGARQLEAEALVVVVFSDPGAADLDAGVVAAVAPEQALHVRAVAQVLYGVVALAELGEAGRGRRNRECADEAFVGDVEEEAAQIPGIGAQDRQ